MFLPMSRPMVGAMNEADRSCDSRTSGALWVAAGLSVPAEVDGRLRAGGVALEVGCGGGLGCLALAEAYPNAEVVGHDRDVESIARARALAQAAHLDGRVHFVVSDSERLPRNAYDLVSVATLSDRRQALEVLNAIRNAIASCWGDSSVAERWIACAGSPSERASRRSASYLGLAPMSTSCDDESFRSKHKQ
jgi:SAM-dependent methyltransferase